MTRYHLALFGVVVAPFVANFLYWVLFALMVFCGEAFAVEHTLHWRHPTPENVVGFQVEMGAASGVYDLTREVEIVGLVPLGRNLYSATVEIGTPPTFIVMRALGDQVTSLTSTRSNEIVIPEPSVLLGGMAALVSLVGIRRATRP